MPFKSKAQIQKFYELHKQGKISAETIARMAMETKDAKKLPEKVEKKTNSSKNIAL